jgi:hypothetical protein
MVVSAVMEWRQYTLYEPLVVGSQRHQQEGLTGTDWDGPG